MFGRGGETMTANDYTRIQQMIDATIAHMELATAEDLDSFEREMQSELNNKADEGDLRGTQITAEEALETAQRALESAEEKA